MTVPKAALSKELGHHVSCFHFCTCNRLDRCTTGEAAARSPLGTTCEPTVLFLPLVSLLARTAWGQTGLPLPLLIVIEQTSAHASDTLIGLRREERGKEKEFSLLSVSKFEMSLLMQFSLRKSFHFSK
jgi:hypothetical protein